MLLAYNIYLERGEATGILLDSTASWFKFSIIIPGLATIAVRDIYKVYKIDRDIIYRTYEVYISSLKYGEAIFIMLSRATSYIIDSNFLSFDYITTYI